MFRRYDNGDTADRLPLLATFGQRADADAGVDLQRNRIARLVGSG
jgi:hypothetical protein